MGNLAVVVFFFKLIFNFFLVSCKHTTNFSRCVCVNHAFSES